MERYDLRLRVLVLTSREVARKGCADSRCGILSSLPVGFVLGILIWGAGPRIYALDALSRLGVDASSGQNAHCTTTLGQLECTKAMSDYEWGERWDVLIALPPKARAILDVGCGSGLGFLSLVKQGVEVVGVDVDPAAIEKARPRLSEARVMDVEREGWPTEWRGCFDVVAFCDSLEHMVDPWRVLECVRPLLRQGGRVVVSLPNVRQWRTVVKLMAGSWRYTEGPGLMNRGHLHFFTRQTIRDLFSVTGYQRPTFHLPRRTFHLRPPERVVNRLSFGLLADLLYDSHTVSAEPAA